MPDQAVTIEPRQFAALAVNALHAAFINASRAQAKRHFARVQGGAVLDLGTLSAQGGGEVTVRVTLDHSEYRGRFGFTVFRGALEQLLRRLAEKVRFKEDVNLYTSQETGAMLFNVPSVVRGEGETNVFMLGMDRPESGSVTLRLQFLDPRQFQRTAEQ